jgi:hypothetical protein
MPCYMFLGAINLEATYIPFFLDNCHGKTVGGQLSPPHLVGIIPDGLLPSSR